MIRTLTLFCRLQRATALVNIPTTKQRNHRRLGPTRGLLLVHDQTPRRPMLRVEWKQFASAITCVVFLGRNVECLLPFLGSHIFDRPAKTGDHTFDGSVATSKLEGAGDAHLRRALDS